MNVAIPIILFILMCFFAGLLITKQTAKETLDIERLRSFLEIKS